MAAAYAASTTASAQGHNESARRQTPTPVTSSQLVAKGPQVVARGRSSHGRPRTKRLRYLDATRDARITPDTGRLCI